MQTWNFVGLNFPAWVDLPRWEELQAASYLPQALRLQLATYHAVPKGDAAALAERRQQLIAWGAGAAVDASLEPTLLFLRALAGRKAQYLSCLEQIIGEGWDEPARLAKYLGDTAELKDQRWQVLRLTENRFLHPERASFWGHYHMECLDPCHRQQPELYRIWEELPELRRLPFLLWLETMASSVLHERWVRYLSREEQAEARLRFEDGRILNSRGRALNCPERQHFIFVIDLAQHIYALRAEPHLCHASFTRGQPVLGSGIMQAREGKVLHVKFESGHYLSGPEHWWQALEILKEAGCAMEEKLRITVFDRFRYISVGMKAGDLESKARFMRALGLSA